MARLLKLTSVRRAIGSVVMACLLLVTAIPLAAITVGGECEKKCCDRKNAAHACCKRQKAGAGLGLAASSPRCCSGNASVGLVRIKNPVSNLPANSGIAPVVTGEAQFHEAAQPVLDPLSAHALFGRPPPPFHA